MNEPRWWVLHEDDLRRMLYEAAGGQNVGTIIAENYANATREEPDAPNR